LHCLRAGGEEVLLENYAQLFPDALQFLEVLGVLALVLNLGVDAYAASVSDFPGEVKMLISLLRKSRNVPSNILTAVGKSLTRRAALRAAMTTLGEGTRS